MFFDDVMRRNIVTFCFIFVYKSDSNEGNKNGTVEGNKNGPRCVASVHLCEKKQKDRRIRILYNIHFAYRK